MLFIPGLFAESASVWSKCLVNNPHSFWCDVEDDVPQLAKLAKTVLGCSPHAASCERVWSSAAALVTKSRNRLSSPKIDMMLRIKHYYTSGNRQNGERRIRNILTDVSTTTFPDASLFGQSADSGADDDEDAVSETVVGDVYNMSSIWEDDLTGEIDDNFHRMLDMNSQDRVLELIKFAAS